MDNGIVYIVATVTVFVVIVSLIYRNPNHND